MFLSFKSPVPSPGNLISSLGFHNNEMKLFTPNVYLHIDHPHFSLWLVLQHFKVKVFESELTVVPDEPSPFP